VVIVKKESPKPVVNKENMPKSEEKEEKKETKMVEQVEKTKKMMYLRYILLQRLYLKSM
jgi:hypothetical protein